MSSLPLLSHKFALNNKVFFLLNYGLVKSIFCVPLSHHTVAVFDHANIQYFHTLSLERYSRGS